MINIEKKRKMSETPENKAVRLQKRLNIIKNIEKKIKEKK